MEIDKIRELGKKEIGYERHKTLTGEGSANSVLYYWMLGFQKAQEYFDNDYKKLWEGECISRAHYEQRTDELLDRIKELEPTPLKIADGYLGAKFLNYSDDEQRWNEVEIVSVNPDGLDIKNIDEDSEEYHNKWTINDGEFTNINNSKRLSDE